jgi:hypothetical protein
MTETGMAGAPDVGVRKIRGSRMNVAVAETAPESVTFTAYPLGEKTDPAPTLNFGNGDAMVPDSIVQDGSPV